jgi:hypothetical protein
LKYCSYASYIVRAKKFPKEYSNMKNRISYRYALQCILYSPYKNVQNNPNIHTYIILGSYCLHVENPGEIRETSREHPPPPPQPGGISGGVEEGGGGGGETQAVKIIKLYSGSIAGTLI